MMSIEAPWFWIMVEIVFELFSCLNVKIIAFELKKTTFVVYLIMLSPDDQWIIFIKNKIPTITITIWW
jgi:hypothetical protein